jgi:hypothetical protein
MFKRETIPTASDQGVASIGATFLNPGPINVQCLSLSLAIGDAIVTASADVNLQFPVESLLHVIAILRDVPLHMLCSAVRWQVSSTDLKHS